MALRSLALALCLVVLSAPATRGQAIAPEPTRPGAAQPGNSPAKERAEHGLDALFARLAAAKDEQEAGGIARLIEGRLARSGSDTADLLLERSGEALQAADAPLAVELLDRVTQLKPDWAEAWARRAAAFHKLDDPAQAMLDLQQALAREPRHYDAWLALGHVEMANGDKRRALAAYRRALRLHPFLAAAKSMVERLSPDIEGRDL